MKQFKVFKHPDGSLEAVKQGWSWPGFLFSGIWAIVKKLWFISAVFFAGFMGFSLFLAILGVPEEAIGVIINLCSLVLCVLFGINGNRWREQNLCQRGYDEVDLISAANPEGALALYIKQNRT